MSITLNFLLKLTETGDLTQLANIYTTHHGIGIDEADENGISTLQAASANNHPEIVTYLLAKGANADLGNKSGWTPLHHASYHGHNETIKILLQAKASPSIRNKFGATALNVAAASGHVSTVKLLIGAGALEEEEASEEFPCCPHPAATASLFGNEAVLSYLLDQEPIWKNAPALATLWTPLMFSASSGMYATTRSLLNVGADVTVVNAAGKTAFELAHESVEVLLQASSKSLNIRNSTRESIRGDVIAEFLEACKVGDIETVGELFSDNQDLDVNSIEEETGATGLMLAAIIGHLELTKMLIGLGANLNAKDYRYGWTALMQATFYGQREVAKILLKAGADPTIAAMNGCTALDLATLVEETDTSMIRLLAQETINVAPPFMAFLPNSRTPSALSRSMSTPAISSSRKQSAKGLKAWWNKISRRFKALSQEEKITSPVTINIIPDEPSEETNKWDVESITITEDYEQNPYAAVNLQDESLIFTLGFSAATKDLASHVGVIVEEPELKPMIFDHDTENSSESIVYSIDTAKLLGNYNSRLGRKRTTSERSSSHSLQRQKPSRSKSRSKYDDFRPRTDSLVERKSSRKVKHKDVSGVLRDLDLAKYISIFEEQEVDYEAFKLLEESDLIEMGIQKPTVRRKIMAAVKRMSSRS